MDLILFQLRFSRFSLSTFRLSLNNNDINITILTYKYEITSLIISVKSELMYLLLIYILVATRCPLPHEVVVTVECGSGPCKGVYEFCSSAR